MTATFIYGRISGVWRSKWLFWSVLLLLGGLNGLYLWYSPLDLSGDEAYYWEWSRRPALCYQSKGPMVAWVIYAATHLVGNTTFAVRLPAVLLSLGTMALVYASARLLFRAANEPCEGFAPSQGLTEILAVLLLAASPMINVGGSIMTIDVLLCFFALAAIYCVWQAVRQNKMVWWVLGGAAICLAILSKFTGIFLILSLLAYLALCRAERYRLRTIGPYICCGIGLLAFAPVVAWNLSHGFVTFRQVASEGESITGSFFAPKWFLDLLGTQMLAMTPPILLTVLLGCLGSLRRAWGRTARAGAGPLRARSRRRGWRLRASEQHAVARPQGIQVALRMWREHLFLQCFALPTLLFYILLSFHTRILPNWPVMAYLPATIAASVVVAEKLGAWRGSMTGKLLRAWLALCIILGLTVSALGRFPSALCALGAPPRVLPSNRLIGWRELGERVGRTAAEMGGEGKVFILSDMYQIAAEIAFYTDRHYVTYCMPGAYRRLNQYDFWPGCGNRLGQNAIYVSKMPAGRKEKVKEAFASVVEEPPLEVRQSGEVVRTFCIFRCYGFRGFAEETRGAAR